MKAMYRYLFGLAFMTTLLFLYFVNNDINRVQKTLTDTNKNDMFFAWNNSRDCIAAIDRMRNNSISTDEMVRNRLAEQKMLQLIRANQPGPSTDEVKLIILTYMRSGSSFTGDLIQQHPDVFYIYEPLWSIKDTYERYKSRLLRFWNGTTLHISNETDLWYGRLRIMKSVLSCNFADLDIGTQTQWYLPSVKATFPYRQCLNRSNRNETKVKKCLEELSANCRRSKVKAIKVISAEMEHARAMIKSDPTVKVIHLIRDPRGCLKSQSSVSVFKWKNLEEIQDASVKLCKRIERDINRSKLTSSEFPGRILTVRYEDIVRSPVEATRQMYTFLGLHMTSSIEKYIWNITYSGVPDGCNVCSERGNSNVTANAWRKKVTPKLSIMIQENCAHIFPIMGYRSLRTKKEMMNLNISSYEDQYDPCLMSLRTG